MEAFLEQLRQAGAPAELLQEIVPLVGHRTLRAHQLLAEPGQLCQEAYLVLRGGFVCRYVDAEQDLCKTVNFFLPDFHPYMSCVDSFFSGQPTGCELRAIAASEVLVFPKAHIEAFIRRDIRLFSFFHDLVTTALQEENSLKLKIIAYPSAKLYDYLLAECPHVVRQVPARYIAELMGISPEWLSKLKGRR
ncbi:MAG: hypothetical protein NW241_08210 [Bacteroidia bacterium]|nr:hypothetical protein [Bacteroidia bacterium]